MAQTLGIVVVGKSKREGHKKSVTAELFGQVKVADEITASTLDKCMEPLCVSHCMGIFEKSYEIFAGLSDHYPADWIGNLLKGKLRLIGLSFLPKVIA